MFTAGCCICPKALFRAAFLLLVLMVIGIPGRPSSAQPAGGSQPLRLIGVIEGGKFAGAVLVDSTGEQTFYRMREELPDGSRIVKMANDHIVIKRSDGTSYELFIIHDTKPSAQPPHAAASAPSPAVVAPPVTAPQSGAAGADLRAKQPRLRRQSGPRGAAADRQSSSARSKTTRAKSGASTTGLK